MSETKNTKILCIFRMNIKEKLQQYKAQSDKIIGCGFGDKHGM